MILELADLRIQPGRQAEFEAALRHGLSTVISKATGYVGHEIRHGIESPERYLVMISWQTLEHHTVDFRGGPLFTQWREIVGPFFAAAPLVEHFDVLKGSS